MWLVSKLYRKIYLIHDRSSMLLKLAVGVKFVGF
jgi:hypothetical protein